MMFNEFVKYHSLGNNFIIFDWYKKPDMYVEKELKDSNFINLVIKLCDRYKGVGADGVIIIKRNQARCCHAMLIYNADGTQAENCLNGLRCVVHYLFTTYKLPNQFSIGIGKQFVSCSMPKPSTS